MIVSDLWILSLSRHSLHPNIFRPTFIIDSDSTRRAASRRFENGDNIKREVYYKIVGGGGRRRRRLFDDAIHVWDDERWTCLLIQRSDGPSAWKCEGVCVYAWDFVCWLWCVWMCSSSYGCMCFIDVPWAKTGWTVSSFRWTNIRKICSLPSERNCIKVNTRFYLSWIHVWCRNSLNVVFNLRKLNYIISVIIPLLIIVQLNFLTIYLTYNLNFRCNKKNPSFILCL